MKTYKMSEEELIIHNIIRDTRLKFDSLDVEEVVKDLATLNYIRTLLTEKSISLHSALFSYRDNLLHYLETL